MAELADASDLKSGIRNGCAGSSPASATLLEEIMKTITLSDEALGALATQLYRYYDIEVDEIHQVSEVGEVKFKDLRWRRGRFDIDFKVPVYRIFYNGGRSEYVSMKIYPHTIEDLYVVVNGELEEPTTSKAEQELR